MSPDSPACVLIEMWRTFASKEPGWGHGTPGRSAEDPRHPAWRLVERFLLRHEEWSHVREDWMRGHVCPESNRALDAWSKLEQPTWRWRICKEHLPMPLAQVAEITGIKVRALQAAAKSGDLLAWRPFGGRWSTTLDEVRLWREWHPHGGRRWRRRRGNSLDKTFV